VLTQEGAWYGKWKNPNFNTSNLYI
jgi:hypothetical protein